MNAEVRNALTSLRSSVAAAFTSNNAAVELGYLSVMKMGFWNSTGEVQS